MNRDANKGSASVVVCTFAGWICLLLQFAALYNGGESHHGYILRALGSGNIGYAIGSFFGSGLVSIIAMILGIIIRRTGAGTALMAAAGITMLITMFVM